MKRRAARMKDKRSPVRIFAEAKRRYGPQCSLADFQCGFQLLKQAAAHGHTGAHEWLGAVYDYGLGTKANRRLAFKHYKIAADSGRPNAEYHVGVFTMTESPCLEIIARQSPGCGGPLSTETQRQSTRSASAICTVAGFERTREKVSDSILRRRREASSKPSILSQSAMTSGRASARTQ